MATYPFLLRDLPWHTPGAEVVRWLRQPGDRLAPDTPLVIVLTDRVEAVLPAGVAGTLATLAAAVGGQVAPGAALALVEGSEDVGQQLGASRPRITPLARKLALASGIDLATLVGSGPHGRIWLRDVVAVREARGDERRRTKDESGGGNAARTETQSQWQEEGAMLQPPIPNPQSPIQNPKSKIQNPKSPLPNPKSKIQNPKSPIPYALTARECDLWRVSGDHMAAVVLAALEELPRHQQLCGSWSDDGIVLRRRLHLGLADGGGRLVRVIADAGDLNLRGLTRALGSGAVPADATEPTFVVAPLGPGVWWRDLRRLPLGGVAALGIGAPRRQPVVVGAGLAVRSIVLLTLAYDARVATQREADAFLAAVCARLSGDDSPQGRSL